MSEKKNTVQRKHEVLLEFTKVIQKHDPMVINSPHEEEYEGEALSILSRFTESALHVADDEEAAFEVAAGIVTECFTFWFDELSEGLELEGLTLDLLTVYVNSYPEEDAKPTPGRVG
jgi:hypothetical protein